jgi:hypothetical protein
VLGNKFNSLRIIEHAPQAIAREDEKFVTLQTVSLQHEKQPFEYAKISTHMRNASMSAAVTCKCVLYLRKCYSCGVRDRTHAFRLERGVADRSTYFHDAAHPTVVHKATGLYCIKRWQLHEQLLHNETADKKRLKPHLLYALLFL